MRSAAIRGTSRHPAPEKRTRAAAVSAELRQAFPLPPQFARRPRPLSRNSDPITGNSGGTAFTTDPCANIAF
jgi:hypothetical protein